MGWWRFGPTRIREFARLPADRRRRLLTALRLLWLVRIGLWTVSFRRMRAILGRLERAGRRRDDSTADELVWCVAAASRYVPAATCLVRSMAAQVMLSRCGHQSTLRIGVTRRPGARLEAHAWVECDGRVVVGELHDLERFTPLPSLGPATAK